MAQHQLCTMEPDGSQVTQLHSGDCISNLDWSPDGKRTAFDAANAGLRSLFSIDADGTGFAQHGRGTSPAWLVDETKFLYSLYTTDIYLLDPGAKDRVNLTGILRRHGGVNTFVNEDPSWTPTDW